MNTDNFKWTDELVKEFAYSYLENEGKKCKLGTSRIKQFKQSKEDKYKDNKPLFTTEDGVDIFGENYYMNGIESGVSNYVDYTWMPELTLLMAKSFMQIFGIDKESTVLDFGCARGYFVKALREHQVRAFGVDISEWAIKNCDSDVVRYVFNKLEDCPPAFDYIFSKDVLEHIPTEELTKTLEKLFTICTEAIIFIVPLAKSEGGKYIYPADELDKTHIHRKTLQGWIDLIEPFAKDFTIFVSQKIPSLKKASEQFEGSTGIIYCKKIKNNMENNKIKKWHYMDDCHWSLRIAKRLSGKLTTKILFVLLLIMTIWFWVTYDEIPKTIGLVLVAFAAFNILYSSYFKDLDKLQKLHDSLNEKNEQ